MSAAASPSSSLPAARRIYLSGTGVCDVPFEQAWSSLLDKIRHPEKYVGSRDVKWTDGNGDDGREFVDRIMVIGPPDRPSTMSERITWDRQGNDKGTVTFTAHNDKEKDGAVLNILERRGDLLTLTFTFEFAFKEGVPQEKIDGMRTMLTEGIGKVINTTVSVMKQQQQ